MRPNHPDFTNFAIQSKSNAIGVILALIFILGLAASALAQGGSRGAISGTVRDEKGAGVAGAQIEIINSVTGVTERTATSDESGNFTVTQLPAGDYRLVVSNAGFSKSEVSSR
jgi:uncharacterized surface anchored protein